VRLGAEVTWIIKQRNERDVVLLSEDPKHAIGVVDQLRGNGFTVWIEDTNGKEVDEAALRKAAQ
jgi:hypothetical protein